MECLVMRETPKQCEIAYHGLQPHVVDTLVKHIHDQKDDIDRMLDRAKFEADAISDE